MTIKSFLKAIAILAALTLTLQACEEDDPFRIRAPDFSAVPEPFSIEGAEKEVRDNGMIVYYIEEGTGNYPVVPRDIVAVYYTGRKTNGEIFDSSYRDSSLTPQVFTLNQSNSAGGFSLTEGFRLGLIGMKEGEKRKLVIPPDLGYAGTGNRLASDTLVFDIELEQIISNKRAFID